MYGLSLVKCQKKWTLKKIFPRFSILVLKPTSFITDFAYHGFLFPQKISDKRGLPVPILCSLSASGIYETSKWKDRKKRLF